MLWQAGIHIIVMNNRPTPPSQHETTTTTQQLHDDNDLATIWKHLTEWVTQHGGSVHQSLHLQQGSSSRGVFCRSTIAAGETLIRLPAQLALGGTGMPACYDVAQRVRTNSQESLSADRQQHDDDHDVFQAETEGTTRRRASTWLRCLAAFYHNVAATGVEVTEPPHEEDCLFAPYAASLPNSYDTLWQWTADEVQTYLAGTTASPAAAGDDGVGWSVNRNAVMERYRQQIRPYLREHCNIRLLLHPTTAQQKNDDEDEDLQEYKLFAQACQVLSTRAFHLSGMHPQESTRKPTSTSDSEDSSYTGPFLLPVIDLLNHSKEKKCTTLQRTNTTGDFLMVAERTIYAGEEVLHSYGDELTASQFLQTFGFVPQSATVRAAAASCNRRTMALQSPTTFLTPAILSRTMVLEACWHVIESNQPEQLARSMREQGLEDEVWAVRLDRSRDASFLPRNYLVSRSSNSGLLLSDELVTLACLPFLPRCAYNEAANSLLDQDILQDYFLGNLVCAALLQAIHTKLATYTPIRYNGEVKNDDAVFLQQLLQEEETTVPRRLIYGLTVRLEEQQTLHALRREVVCIVARLNEEAGFLDIDSGGSGDPKKQRTAD